MAQNNAAEELEEVIVTGSYIKGTPTDAPSPVSVVDRAELEQRGTPSVIDIVQSFSFSSGTENQSNQFASNNTQGTANINLRGLGLSRTLVLMNGRRMVTASMPANDGSAFVDINTIPALAIQRIEVLKDGAAATYGSDAIAGVANFNTRGDFEGLEFSGSFTDVDGSDGDFELGAIWGVAGDNYNWVTSIGYNERTELPNSERLDIITPRVDTLPTPVTFAVGAPAGLTLFGQSSTGNPGSFIPISAAAAADGVSELDAFLSTTRGFNPGLRAGLVRDPNCEAAGGVVSTSNRCGFNFVPFSNLIEDEERLQLFSELRYSLSDTTTFYGEVLYANTDIPNFKTSPSFPPAVETDPSRYIAPDHPGLVRFLSENPGIMTGGAPNAGLPPLTADFSGGAVFLGRPIGVTGPAEEGTREQTTYRFLAGLEGEFANGMTYNTSLMYSENEFNGTAIDTVTSRYSEALAGLGGPDCTGTTPGENGCLYYNPFSSAIPGSPNFDAALANSPELLEWLVDEVDQTNTSSLLVFEAVFTGQVGEFNGEPLGYAVGLQYRDEELDVDFKGLGDIDENPGVVNPLSGGRPGVFTFVRGGTDSTVDQDVYALFGELAVPLAENLDLQLALRYEDYGGNIGDSIDPKVALRWDINEMLTLRGSASTTFRAPSLNQNTGQSTALEFNGRELAFKAVDRIGNPDLDPEEAVTFNVGAIIRPSDFSEITLDYWSFSFSDPIVREDPNALITDVAAQNEGNICGFSDQIECDGLGRIARITTNFVNGPDIETNGIDLSAVYNLAEYWTFGLDLTYVNEYEVDPFQGRGSFDAAGSLNAATFVRPIPELKGAFNVNFNMENHNVRFITSYIDSYTDNASDVLLGTVFEDAIFNREIDSHVTYDLFYTFTFNEDDTVLSASVINLSDEDPPEVRADLRYDAQTHNAFGRMIKVGFKHRL
ncbi:TonB-dependent receptor [Exilibacterium tricleocarpae]|uniref:TonB-dependent receptor n=1 Tax=Exilibacterium tricleocarpae TaxID=2591008 RepID=A0A545TSJ6_9GAMM|nr:TonB-dependent receptor [Exilibacterium tricleocarpae]TQV80198.1 TonB-dependent receptor [Exilibacterium tricleocarpae]